MKVDNKVFIECGGIPFTYHPQYPNSYRKTGEARVRSLIQESTTFHSNFNKIVPLEDQRSLMEKEFRKQKEIWYSTTPNVQAGGTKYFQTNRKFNHLVPELYHRTEAPRLSAKGSTAHGMKKVLLMSILKELSSTYYITFADIDMSACHTRIACMLMNNDNRSLIFKSLHDSNFWSQRVAFHSSMFQTFNIDFPAAKKALKVSLYTALNGGNPSGSNNIDKNIDDNLYDTLLPEERHLETFDQTKLGIALVEAFKNDPLLIEVAHLNKMCVCELDFSNQKQLLTYGVDRYLPYDIKSPHMGISRVFQSFEVVLLTYLVESIPLNGFQILSLDHDGVLCYKRGQHSIESFKNSLVEIEQHYKDAPSFLLRSSLPLEFKRIISNGQLHEF